MEGKSKGSTYKMKGSPMQRNFGSPVKELTNEEKQANLLKVVPNEEAYNLLSDIDKKNFDATGAKVGLPTKEAPVKNYKKGYYGA